jgi:hypothetical protein
MILYLPQTLETHAAHILQGDVSVRLRAPPAANAAAAAAAEGMRSVSLLRDCALEEPGCRPGVAFCAVGRPDRPPGLLGFRLAADELVERVMAAAAGCEAAAAAAGRRADSVATGTAGTHSSLSEKAGS